MMNDDVSQSTKLFGLTDWRSLSMSPMTERTRESSKKRKEKSRSWSKNFFVFVLLIFWSGKQQMCRSRRDSRAQMDRWPWRCVHFRPAVFFFLPIQQENWEKWEDYVCTTDIHFKVGFFFLSILYFGSNWCGFPLSHYFTCCRPGGGRRKKKGTEAEGDFIEGRFTSSSNRWWEQILLFEPNWNYFLFHFPFL